MKWIENKVKEEANRSSAKSGTESAKKGRRGKNEFKTAHIFNGFIKKFGKGGWATWHKKHWGDNYDAQKRAFRKICTDVLEGKIGSDPPDASASE